MMPIVNNVHETAVHEAAHAFYLWDAEARIAGTPLKDTPSPLIEIVIDLNHQVWNMARPLLLSNGQIRKGILGTVLHEQRRPNYRAAVFSGSTANQRIWDVRKSDILHIISLMAGPVVGAMLGRNVPFDFREACRTSIQGDDIWKCGTMAMDLYQNMDKAEHLLRRCTDRIVEDMDRESVRRPILRLADTLKLRGRASGAEAISIMKMAL
jgi:hypothetical protein